jgi:hypothetical protein
MALVSSVFTMISDSKPRNKRAVVEFAVDERKAVGNIQNRLRNVHGVCTVDRNPVGQWAKRVKPSDSGKANLYD